MKFKVTYEDGKGNGEVFLEAKNFERLCKNYYKDKTVTEYNDGWILESKQGEAILIEVFK